MGRSKDLKIMENIKQVESVKEGSRTMMKVIKGSIIAIIVTIILLTIYAVVLAYTNVSENTMVPVIFTITGISILIGSSISSKHIKKQGILNGGLIGGIYVIVIYIASSIFTGNFSLDVNSIVMVAIGVITGMIGGIIGVNLK